MQRWQQFNDNVNLQMQHCLFAPPYPTGDSFSLAIYSRSPPLNLIGQGRGATHPEPRSAPTLLPVKGSFLLPLSPSA